MATPVRLQRYLAAAGVAARRKAEDLITAGRVTVNGKVVTTLGTKVDADRDQVTVDGEAVMALDKFYVLFNKPKACITAVSDDRGRMTVMDYLPNLPVPVKPVGRLDFYTEGVLLLTNDGELAARLLAPSNHVPKTYHVKVHGHVRPEHVRGLRSGVQLDDGTVTMPADVEVLPAESKHTWLAITIHEGKHRQIHRMLEALGYRVDKLQRVAFANLTFHHLRVGDARELTQQELNQLRDLVGLDHSTVARGKWRAKREQTDIPRRARAKAIAEAEAGRDDRDDTWEWSDAGERGIGAEPGHDLAQHTAETADGDTRRYGGSPRAQPGTGSRRSDSSRDTREPRGGQRDTRGARGGQRDTGESRGGQRDTRGAPGGQRDMREAQRDMRGSRGGQRDTRGTRGGQRATRGSEGERGTARGGQRDTRGSGPRRNDGPRDTRTGPRDAGPRRSDQQGGTRTPRDSHRSSGVKRAGQGRTFGKRAGGRRG